MKKNRIPRKMKKKLKSDIDKLHKLNKYKLGIMFDKMLLFNEVIVHVSKNGAIDYIL